MFLGENVYVTFTIMHHFILFHVHVPRMVCHTIMCPDSFVDFGAI